MDLQDMEVQLAKLETKLTGHIHNCLEDRRELNRNIEVRNDYIERQRLELWTAIDSMRPMIYKLWGGVLIIPTVIAIILYLIVR